jgi:hypothetical protein
MPFAESKALLCAKLRLAYGIIAIRELYHNFLIDMPLEQKA